MGLGDALDGHDAAFPPGYFASGGGGFVFEGRWVREWYVGSNRQRLRIIGDRSDAWAVAHLMYERDSRAPQEESER